MAIRTREEILASINERFSEDTTDETISLIEDISDTLEHLENSSTSGKNWKEKYETNDKEWRQKYKDRFFNTTSDITEQTEEEDEVKPKTFDDLFEEEK